MTFSEFAKGLFPYISYGKAKPVFINELVGNFISDAAMDACVILQRKPDTKYRYFTGSPIQPDDAQYLYTHRDTDKFSKWVWDQMDESDSYDAVSKWLEKNKILFEDPSVACANLFEAILLNIISAPDSSPSTEDSEIDFKLIEEIQDKIKNLHRPTVISVPTSPTNDEHTYICELFRAYGDCIGIPTFTETDLLAHPDFIDDLDDRRIDYYAAESIRRSVLEFKSNTLSDQFTVLKDDTLVGVKDTAKRAYPNGYERMLAVMEKAVTVPVDNYLLSNSPYWINGRIKKGVCHHLVNDGQLYWLIRRNERHG